VSIQQSAQQQRTNTSRAHGSKAIMPIIGPQAWRLPRALAGLADSGAAIGPRLGDACTFAQVQTAVKPFFAARGGWRERPEIVCVITLTPADITHMVSA
jgi:hypothetical protein